MLQCKMKCSMACLADPIRLNTIDRICAGTDTDSNRCPSHVAIVRGSADKYTFLLSPFVRSLIKAEPALELLQNTKKPSTDCFFSTYNGKHLTFTSIDEINTE